MDGVDNIQMSLKNQINDDDLHQEDSFLTLKSAILSIVNTLNKIIIARDLYEKYEYNFYEDFHIDFLTWSSKSISDSVLMNCNNLT